MIIEKIEHHPFGAHQSFTSRNGEHYGLFLADLRLQQLLNLHERWVQCAKTNRCVRRV